MNSGLCEHCLRVAYLVTDMTILLGMDEKALQYLKNNAGTKFDPKLTEVFARLKPN